ncbi:MAG: trypsin-like peptidase domain-containing protein [Candidatus Accumulibacter sp.]|nr:trypsin-like peptidase domain-containing protein [Accumulibacter sp.]
MLCPLLTASAFAADLSEIVDKVKPSVVVIGTFQLKRSPQFIMRGTGFVVGNGRQIATNAHVVDQPVDISADEKLLVLTRSSANGAQPRAATISLIDQEHDLALLRIDGPALPALLLNPSDTAREGQTIAFTGFPLGGLLGFYSPVTHRGIISAITPIALPANSVRALNARAVSQIRRGAFDIYQLDATAYPGNSGGPLYEAERGEVIGVINMVLVKETKESVMSKPSAISYAIPVKFLRELLTRASQ